MKTYLGDSVYAEESNGKLRLTTENGLPTDPSNSIILEDFVIDALFNYLNQIGDQEIDPKELPPPRGDSYGTSET